MKRKTSPKSAFFTSRALLGFALCLLGVLLIIGAFTVRSLQAQGASQKPSVANSAAPDYAGPPADLRPVQPVRSRPLRDMKPIHPTMAPGHDHPEPIRPAPPTENGGLDGPLQTVQGPVPSAPAPVGTGWDGVGDRRRDGRILPLRFPDGRHELRRLSKTRYLAGRLLHDRACLQCGGHELPRRPGLCLRASPNDRWSARPAG